MNFVHALKKNSNQNGKVGTGGKGVGGGLKHFLHSSLAGEREARSLATIHASEVTREDPKFCPREIALLDITGKKRESEFLSTSMSVVFELGWRIQYMVTDWLASIAVGDWTCRKCRNVAAFCSRPSACGKCGSSVRWDYEECRFESTVTGISAGIDVLVQLDGPALGVVEIKSIDKDKFKTLVAPLAEHRLRTNLYLRVIAESGESHRRHLIDTTKACVLYVSKGGYGVKDTSLKEAGLVDGGYSPFKEFTVERNDEETDEVCTRAKLAHDFRASKVMPGGVCETSFCPRAKSCPVLKECFSGSYPSQ
jgi:hypothetical protein